MRMRGPRRDIGREPSLHIALAGWQGAKLTRPPAPRYSSSSHSSIPSPRPQRGGEPYRPYHPVYLAGGSPAAAYGEKLIDGDAEEALILLKVGPYQVPLGVTEGQELPPVQLFVYEGAFRIANEYGAAGGEGEEVRAGYGVFWGTTRPSSSKARPFTITKPPPL